MIQPLQVLCVAGARPNFIKLAPLFRAFPGAGIGAALVHTGQHYDESLSGGFVRDLGLPEPRYNLGVGSGSHAQQTALIMQRLEPVLLQEAPSAVLVVGDVNSTLAGALVAKKLNIAVIHAEAGLRSFDRTMPEEINRLATDAISDLLLVSEESGVRNLASEGVPTARVRFVGNLMIDTLLRYLPRARESRILDDLDLRGKRFGLVTLHRPANVDQPDQLAEVIRALRQISAGLPLIFPVHPRSKGLLQTQDLGARVLLSDPLGYFDFLCLMSHSAVVLTDSGGIQEETTVLRVPCLTLRNNTERPATIEQGTNRLAGTSSASILRAWQELAEAPAATGVIPKLWDGQAGERSAAAIREAFETGALGAL